MEGPSPEHAVRNWTNSDLPFLAKVGKLVKNNAKKVATLSHCCGNYGEPGC